jgi:hypothetical protein
MSHKSNCRHAEIKLFMRADFILLRMYYRRDISKHFGHIR